jgi:type VI secretion system secreted protein Hcp
MAFDAFLKIRDAAGNILIEGESTDKTHPNEIQIDSFSWGVSNPTSVGSGGGGSGKAVPQDYHFTAPVSKASPNLMLACATGRHLPEADLTLRKAGGPGQVEFVKMRLTDCLISTYAHGGSASDGPPEDSFSIAFAKVEFIYTVARTGEVVDDSFDFSFNPAGG